MSETDENKEVDPPETALSEVQNAPEPPPPSYADTDISLDAALSKEANTQTPLDEKKKKQLLFGGVGIFCLIVVLSVFSCQPAKGSMAYGICSTFLELNTAYPHTIHHVDLEGSYTAVRIYFTNTDPFGQYKMETIECTFGADEVMGMKLTQVARNRRPVDPAIVDKFNLTLPTIMASEPYVVLPPNWKNQLLPE